MLHSKFCRRVTAGKEFPLRVSCTHLYTCMQNLYTTCLILSTFERPDMAAGIESETRVGKEQTGGSGNGGFCLF